MLFISFKYLRIKVALIVVCILLLNCNREIEKYFYKPPDIESKQKVLFHQKECNNPLNYIPDNYYPQHTITKYVKINFHIIQDEKGERNFSEEEGRGFVKFLIDISNEWLNNNQKVNLPLHNTFPVLPIKYQLVLAGDNDEGIYFHKDSILAFVNKKGSGSNSLYSSQPYEKYGVKKGEVINFFILEHHPDSVKSKTYKPSTDGICAGNWGKLLNFYRISLDSVYDETIKQNVRKYWHYERPGIFLHELGHCLGLSHTWNINDGCDDTPQNRSCYSKYDDAECDSVWTNNMMDYNAYQNALSPCQIGKIHWNIQNNSSVRKFIQNTWCSPEKTNDIKINRNVIVEWKCNKDIEGNLILQENSILMIRCRVSMPENSKIIIKPGAKLVLDGAVITNDCKLNWQGIEIWKTNNKEGYVELLNGAKTEYNLY